MRNIHVFVSRYLYNLNNQVNVEMKCKFVVYSSFQLTMVKPKLTNHNRRKQSTWMSQSELEVNTCNRRQARENAFSQDTIGQFLLLLFIGWESGTGFVNQWPSTEKQNQTLITWKPHRSGSAFSQALQNSNWEEADQLSFYKRGREDELRATENNSSKRSVRKLNRKPSDYKSDALTSGPHGLLDGIVSLTNKTLSACIARFEVKCAWPVVRHGYPHDSVTASDHWVEGEFMWGDRCCFVSKLVNNWVTIIFLLIISDFRGNGIKQQAFKHYQHSPYRQLYPYTRLGNHEHNCELYLSVSSQEILHLLTVLVWWTYQGTTNQGMWDPGGGGGGGSLIKVTGVIFGNFEKNP